MCLQCTTDAKYITRVLDTFALMQASKSDGDEWLAGQWGLVFCNDPDVIWSGPMPWPNPSFGVADAVAEAFTAEQNAEANRWSADACAFRDAVETQASAHVCCDLGIACYKAGWSYKEHGGFTHWLYHQMGLACQNPVIPPCTAEVLP